jgi:hypothetical protein
VARFPSVFAESKAKINKEDKPTGIVIGQDQFSKLADFPSMYDDSPIKTGLTLDGAVRNVQTSTGLTENYNDYLTRNPDEKSNFVSIDRFNSKAGEMPQDSKLGFNQNWILTVNRSQNFRSIFNNYQLSKTTRTNPLNVGEGSSASFTDRMEGISKSDRDTFLLVKSSTADGDFIYKIPDIISEGKPKRFSEKVLDPTGKNINYYLFGGYSDRKAKPIKGDHRLKSDAVLESNKLDLITISMNEIALMSNITGLTDTATPSFGSVKGIGSPYSFYFYESFEREISFKVQIYASSEKTLPKVWEKVDKIMSLTKGKAQGQLGIQGNIIKLRIGDIIKGSDGNGVYGFISSCAMNVPDISPWETYDGKQAPFVCELNISFTVIHVTNQSFYDGISDKDNPLFTEDKSKSPGSVPEDPIEVKLEKLQQKVLERKRAEEADLIKLDAGMALDAETQTFLNTQNNEYLRGAIKTARIKSDTADLLNSNIDFGEEAGVVSQQTSFVNDAVRNAIQTRQGELLNESFGPVAFDASINAISGQNVDDIVRRAINNRTSTSALGGAN